MSKPPTPPPPPPGSWEDVLARLVRIETRLVTLAAKLGHPVAPQRPDTK